ncbi:MAG TPA: hypothetical protein VFT72_01180 [Opitutaceae bacterium]|nr:hypothetical protein [Opitutaceae bacterium]
MPLPCWETLIKDPATWGSQNFVQLTIGINLAVFSIEKLRNYGRLGRERVKKSANAALLDLQDQPGKQQALAGVLDSVFDFAWRCHHWVWQSCRGAAYCAAGLGFWIVYADCKNNPWFGALLFPTLVYLLLAFFSCFVLCLGVWFIRSIMKVKAASVAPSDIRQIRESFEAQPKKEAGNPKQDRKSKKRDRTQKPFPPKEDK